MFANREEAGRQLANRLLAYRDDPVVLVLALPRGGVPVGAVISRTLHVPLDVFITRKIGSPSNQEYALGAIAETGYVHINEEAVRYERIGEAFLKSYLDRELEAQKREIARRQSLYRQGKSLPPLENRTIILVDDGVATGSTYLASLHALRESKVGKIVAAIPVGPEDTIQRIGQLVEELIVLCQPPFFRAVGMYYEDFSQVGDEELCHYLREARLSVNKL